MVFKIQKEISEEDRDFITDLPTLHHERNHNFKKLMADSILQTHVKPRKINRYPKIGETWLTANKRHS